MFNLYLGFPMKVKILTNNAPAPIGPYNQGMIAKGTFAIISGQLPLDGSTLAGTTIAEQTAQSLKNVKAILEAGGFTMADVVKTSVYLKDLNDFAGMNEVYAQFFEGTEFPARVAFQVAKLPMDVLVEIEAIAVKD